MKRLININVFILLMMPIFLFSQAIHIFENSTLQDKNWAQIESPIAINPTNPKNMIGAFIAENIDNNGGILSKHIDIVYTLDGGNVWNIKQNISDEGGADPQIVFDQDGIAYLIYQIRSSRALYLKKSNNFGETWSESKLVIQTGSSENVDRPWLAISPVRNNNDKFNLYVSFTHNFSNYAQIDVYKSIDGGESFSFLHSFQGLQNYWPQGSTISFGPDGDVAIAWANYQSGIEIFPVKMISIIYSSNGTFIDYENRFDIPVNQIGMLNNNNDEVEQIKEGVRVDSYPRMAVDPVRGDFYVVWANDNNEEIADIRLYKLRKNGSQVIGEDKGLVIHETGEQFNPAISVSPDGIISIMYYSTENNEFSSPIFTRIRISNDGGNTFPQSYGLGESNGFYIYQQDKYKFLGDYHGLTSWFGLVYALFCQNINKQGYDPKQVYFQKVDINLTRSLPDDYIKLRVDQQDENGFSFGKFERWNQGKFTSYITPIDFIFKTSPGQNKQVIRASQNYKEESYEKYNHWTNVNDVKNHKKFYISENTPPIIAKFKNTSTAKLKALCISGNVTTKAKFKDPWLLLEEPYYNDPPYGYRNMGMDSAEFREFTNELNLTHDSDYKGVFLNQGYDPVNHVWTPPYYSVKADAQQTFTAHGQNISGYFLGWEGTDVTFQHADQQETPLVFHAENAEARALYKGHLASSAARATGYNNGRRLCKTNDGKLHLVYEDDNTIWYTFSTNNGQTWAKEYAISPRPYSANFINHIFKNPSIATDGAKLYVAFEEVVQSNSATNHLIDFRKWENNSWRPIENISDGSWQSDWWNGPWSERPSVGANEYGDVLVSWRDKTNGKIKMRYYNNGNWSSVRQIYANGYPEAICMPGENEYPLKLVFSENGLIKYVSARYFNGYWTVSSVQNLSAYAPPMFAEHANPSASVDRYGHGYIAWEAIDQSMDEKHILYQKFNFTHYASSASSVYSLALSMDANLKNASLSYEQSSNYISVFFQDHDQIKRKRTSGSSWYLSSYGSGKYPNICPNKSIGAVWTTYTSAPYLLKTENLNGWLAKSSLAETESFKRFYYSRSDSGYFTVDLKDFTVDGQKLTFYQNLNSDTIEISGLTDFTYQLQIGENCQAGDLLSFLFVTDEQKYFLDEVELSGDQANTVIERRLSLDAGKPSKGYVQIEFSDNEPFVINVVPDNGSGSLAKNVTPQTTTFVPQKFSLKQNFPNPFNPVTQIQFDLPVDARVTLKVFDLSGHEVATLVNGYRSAGRYNVAFDGRHLASGVYIYRLTTNKGFAQSKKMTLIK